MPEDMSSFVKLVRQLRTAGARKHVFSSWTQLPECCKKLESIQEELPNLEGESKVEAIMSRAIFKVGFVSFHCTRSLCDYQDDPFVKKGLSHVSG